MALANLLFHLFSLLTNSSTDALSVALVSSAWSDVKSPRLLVSPR
uniref:Uncharacterized protein n=1 Tax=Arundo donax TaxID=35708 RepID=A0A0A9HKQ3_ARUDO